MLKPHRKCAGSLNHSYSLILKLAGMGFEWICAQSQVINVSAKNRKLEINIKYEERPWAAPHNDKKECDSLSEQILPVEQETEPKPGSSLLWAQWPCDAAVPVAC